MPASCSAIQNDRAPALRFFNKRTFVAFLINICLSPQSLFEQSQNRLHVLWMDPFWPTHFRCNTNNDNTRGGTRTHNLLLRREAPYPLGHTSCAEMQLPLIQPRPSSSKSAAQPYWVSHSACTLLRATADANKMVDARKSLTKHQLKDTLPEWSKGVDSSSTSASCVGSNPTAVMSCS